jgi:pimeloyl-ACP methyl ester carboxylesterase
MDDVLLIHGTAPAEWGELPSLLAGSYRVVEYDRRGYTDLGEPPVADLAAHASDARSRLAGAAILVGWSIGGVIALDVAVRWPECVAGLVLLEPPFRAKRHPTVRMLRGIVGAKARAAMGRPEAGAERFLAWALWRRDGSDDIDRIAPDYRARVRACGRAIVRELDGGTGEHLNLGALAHLDVPTIVLHGTESTPELAAGAERVARLVPSAELVEVSGSGHAIAVDAPVAVSDAVERVAALADARAGAF